MYLKSWKETGHFWWLFSGCKTFVSLFFKKCCRKIHLVFIRIRKPIRHKYQEQLPVVAAWGGWGDGRTISVSPAFSPHACKHMYLQTDMQRHVSDCQRHLALSHRSLELQLCSDGKRMRLFLWLFLYKLPQLAKARLDACLMQASARHCGFPLPPVHTELEGTIYEHIHLLLLKSLRVRDGRHAVVDMAGVLVRTDGPCFSVANSLVRKTGRKYLRVEWSYYANKGSAHCPPWETGGF